MKHESVLYPIVKFNIQKNRVLNHKQNTFKLSWTLWLGITKNAHLQVLEIMCSKFHSGDFKHVGEAW